MQKVRHMEQIGAAVGIIVDHHDEDIQSIIMSDDGTGGGIGIPSVMISKRDGEKLIDFLDYATPEEIQQVAIIIDFSMDKPDDRVEYDVWFTSSNDQALDFLDDFSQTDGTFGDSVLMTPRYVFWKCPYCEQSFLDKNCYSGGKYCAIEEKEDDYKVTGRDIIREDLRQKCVYKTSYNSTATRHIWWDYIQYVHRNCRNAITKDCSENAHIALGIDFKDTLDCVSDSFSGKDWASASVSNSIIDEEIEYWR